MPSRMVLVSHHDHPLLTIATLDLILGAPPYQPLFFQKKALGGFSPHPHVSQVPVTNEVSFTETLDYMNNVVPGSSSVVGVERQALDGCPGSLAGHNMNVSQQALVVAGPQPSSSSFRLPLAGGVNGHSSGVVPPDGSGQGPPPSSSPPPGIALSIVDEDCPRVTTLPTTAFGPDLTHVC
jgi:hypothetical protein